jgi:hypothetical protein
MVLGSVLRPRFIAVLFVAVLCCILLAGLWPFGHPRNEVTWLPNHHAIRFGEYGTVLSLRALSGPTTDSCTVEMWLQPRRADDSGTLFGFYGSGGALGISLHQSLADLRLDNHAKRGRPAKAYIGDVFRVRTPLFLTVASGPVDTAVYLDGVLTRTVSRFVPSAPVCSGSFVVGDSPSSDHTWQGDLYGLAIYRRALTATEIMIHYRSWKAAGRPSESGGSKPDALYLFNESRGNLVHDHGASGGVHLVIPERYVIARPTFLGFPAMSYEGKWDDVEDIVINIGGFVPFGFTLCALLSLRTRLPRVATLTVLAGLAVSLAIETSQVYLPTRNSDLTDVLTNTFGTWLGVILHHWFRSSRLPRSSH